MQVLIKVYEHEFINTVITQELIDSKIEIDESLSEFWVAKFSIPMINIQEDNKIEIREIWNTDKKIFTGYIYKIEPVRKQFGVLNIECRSEKALMNKRLFLKNKSQYEVYDIDHLPVYWTDPTIFKDWRNLWLNQSLTWVYFLKELVIPEQPKVWPPILPYYSFWFINFIDTTFVVDKTTNNIYRIEDWQLLDEWPWTEITIPMVLDDMIDDYSNIYNEPRTYETDFIGNISLDMKRWDNYFDILSEIANQNNASWDIQDWVIKMKQLLWNDYTSWYWYKEIIYNWLYPNNSNIKSINVIWTATRNNIIIAEDSRNNKMFDDSWYIDRIYWVWKNEFRSWNLYLNLQKMLVSWNQVQRTYEVEVEQNTLDVNIWDKIKLVVENTNSYFDINSDVIIIKKNTVYNNWSKKINYWIWEIWVYPMNVENWLYWIQRSVKLLKLW